MHAAFLGMMNHFLREGFRETLDNRLGQKIKSADELEVVKTESGWTVRVSRDLKTIGTVSVATEELLLWLYDRSFKS